METDEEEELQYLCSGCLQAFPESQIHILPHFNEGVGRFVTTFRCEACWPQALEDTRTRVAKAEGWDEILSVIDCLEGHNLMLLEFRRGDPFPVVRALLEGVIEKLGRGEIRLSPGPLRPRVELETSIAEMARNEKLAEAAYDAMYEASPASAKDCFDDARGFFAKAIGIAMRAGLADEAERLIARRDHVVSVYDSQFRRIW
jgi:hypothetical protein